MLNQISARGDQSGVIVELYSNILIAIPDCNMSTISYQNGRLFQDMLPIGLAFSIPLLVVTL